ncbi:cytochrome oxidase maturation protein, cbb3-type [Enterovibrio norvegicus FF-162]|uniref:Cytochrome oxidase maturation protein, cbb3-type n=1 Tax=Enterovibrio norvegicus FF-454 TaxID=1185651 RepID=A0A1E5C9G8_9GAMM|nr:cbb3-type cytochrome oxidase assembly protein CcoS [Enterovibrio norvegicus]OEE62174.1 cytochrome oxidase maturation protein, cbb3-type [Enterovibrio norvegicus FF-454]OEE82250.1 cytochrome oxidase maturation protein, cbb3-type [Enterovibrio norvegicus FF-162]
MESLYILIPIAIMLVCVAVGVFIWAVKSEQFEDLERQGMNILLDDDEKLTPETKTTSATSERSENK